MTLLIIALAASLGFREPQPPFHPPCDQIRALVAQHGRVNAIIWAREHGYTWAQIYEAKKCLK